MLGIISIPLCFIFLPAVLAVIFGAIALGQIRSSGQAGRGQAIAGLVLGCLSLAVIIVAIVVAGSASFEFESLGAFLR